MCPDGNGIISSGEINSSQISSLSLAFMGDAVWELLIRQYILSKGDKKVADLHKASIGFANADFQAEAGEKLTAFMTEEELSVYRRAKNSHSAHTPKNKTAFQYHKATAFEALIGKLYLDGNYKRIFEFFDIIINSTAGDNK